MEALLAPDFEVDATDRVLNPDRYEGIEGFRRLASEMSEVWDSWEIEPLEFLENGDLLFVEHRSARAGREAASRWCRPTGASGRCGTEREPSSPSIVDRDRALAAAGLRIA